MESHGGIGFGVDLGRLALDQVAEELDRAEAVCPAFGSMSGDSVQVWNPGLALNQSMKRLKNEKAN